MTWAELEDLKQILEKLQDICSAHNCNDCQLVGKNHDCIKILLARIITKSERTMRNDND